MIPTVHNEAKEGDIAKTVLMPGDPLRAKYIAETFLCDVNLYNTVRGMLGYTGTYKGKSISVQGSGMGSASIGIYSYELFKFYEVENIIRVGTAGSLTPILNVKDIVIANGASTNSNFAIQYKVDGTFAPTASYEILEILVAETRKYGVKFAIGNVLTSDILYGIDKTDLQRWKDLGVLAIEMETAALYMNASFLGKRAACILTISDSIIKREIATSEEREMSFTDAMLIALESAIQL